MDVIEINLISLKLASDYELSQSEFMSSRIQFPLPCDMLLSVGNYSVPPHPPIMRAVTETRSSECLMATILWPLELSPTSNRKQSPPPPTKYQNKKRHLKVSRLHTGVLAEATVILESSVDQSGTNLIQSWVIRPLECISFWFLAAGMKGRASDAGNVLSHDSKITAGTEAFKLISTPVLAQIM